MLNKKFLFTLIIEVILLLLLADSVCAEWATSLDIFDSEADDETQIQSNDVKVLAGETVTFYANYSSNDGFDLGAVTFRNTTDLGDGYIVRAIDFNGIGNKTGFVYSVLDYVYGFYGNGSEKWRSYNTEFDYAYAIETYDFNNDSQEEVAFMSSGGRLFILNGTNGSILFQSQDYITGYTLAAGDIDLDGRKDDLVLGVSNTTTDLYSLVAFIYNESLGAFINIWNTTDATSTISEVTISEISGSQSLVTLTDGSGGKGIVYYGNKTTVNNSGDLGTAQSTAFFDQNSDGKQEERVITLSSGSVTVFGNSGQTLGTLTEPWGTDYETAAVDLDRDGFYNEFLVSSNFNTVFAFNSNLSLEWQFNPPHREFESLYYFTTSYVMYPLCIKVGNVNNDSFDEIMIGGYGGGRYWILNTSGDLIGKYYYGFENDYVFADYIGITYSKSPGMEIINDSNGDGISEIIVARANGFLSIGQQVMCKINITGHVREEYMYYNYTSKLYHYDYPLDYRIMDGVQNNVTLNWTVKCEKGGYETKSSTKNITVFTKQSSMEVFDQEEDSEDKSSWLSEALVIPNQDTYFFANYTDLEINAPVTDITTKPEWYKDVSIGYGFYDLIAADFDGDKKKESFVYAALDSIVAYSSTGELLWSKGDTNYEYIYDLTSGDFNNDSYDEIAAVGSLGYVIILDKDGNQLYPYNKFQAGYTIVKGDLNDDGIPEIVAGVGDVTGGMGTYYGIVGFAWNVSLESFQIIFRLNDTRLFQPVEIKVAEIPGAPNRVAYVDYTGAEKAYVYYGNGTFIYNSTAVTTSAESLKFFDYYQDGTADDLILGGYGNVYLYNSTGYLIRTDATSTGAVHEVEIIDYSSDGTEDEYVYLERAYVRLEDKAGTQKWVYPLINEYYGSLEVSDINNDGEKEIIVVGGTTGTIIILNKTGGLLTKFSAIFPETMLGEDVATLNNNFYGANTGIDLTNSVNGKKYLGFSAENSNVGAFELYPECIIYFDDNITRRMFFNKSAGVYYHNRTFALAGNYTWNVTCKSINHLQQISITNSIMVSSILEVNLTSPNNNSYFNNEFNDQYSVLLNATIYDLNLINSTIWFYGDGILLNISYNQTNGNSVSHNWTGLSLGLHNWTVIAGNESSNSTNEYYYFNIINLTVNCEAGGPYRQNALVLIQGNVSDGTSGLSSQTINLSLYKEEIYNISRILTSQNDGSFQNSFSDLADGNYTINASISYQGYNKSCSDDFTVGGELTATPASLTLDKIISLHSLNPTNITYNITLRTINKGGSTASSVNLTDSDSVEGSYNIGTILAGNSNLTSYIKSYQRNSTNNNITLAIASVNGTDNLGGAEIIATSSEITIIAPATTADTSMTLIKNAQFLSENETSVIYNLSLEFVNSGGIDLDGIEIKDEDISLDDSINLNRTKSHSTSGIRIINKTSENQEYLFLKANATYDSILYESNQISVLIPALESNASLLLNKIASVYDSTDINITYNISLILTNSGGRNATFTNITDSDSLDSPYDIGTLMANQAETRSYKKTYNKSLLDSNQELAIALANGIDIISSNLINATSSPLNIFIPALKTNASLLLSKIASLHLTNNTHIVYNITLSLTNKGGRNATNSYIFDSNLTGASYYIGNLTASQTGIISYLLDFERKTELTIQNLSIATANATDAISGNLIEANSSEIAVIIPATSTSASFILNKIASFHNFTNTTFTYNITLKLTNKGGSNATTVNITDSNYADYNFSIALLDAGETATKSYMLNFARNSSTYYNVTSIAQAYGMDSFAGALISADSDSINLTIPSTETGQQLTLIKNAYFNSENLTAVNYTLYVEVVNSGGIDLNSITLQDSDLGIVGATALIINLNRTQSYNYSDSLIIYKAASNTNKLFVKATATTTTPITYASNQINVELAGFGGPADTKVYAPASVVGSSSFNSIIEIINQNPDVGQNFIIDYWITNNAETINYTSSQQTTFVPASGTVNSTVTLTAPSLAGTYKLRAMVSYVGGPDISFDSFEVTTAPVSEENATSGGDSGGGGGGGITGKTIYEIKDENILSGIIQILKDGEKVKFNTIQKRPYGQIKSEGHSLEIVDLQLDKVTIIIYPESVMITLKIGEGKKLDLDSDDFYDLYVRLEKIENNKAHIYIKSIYENVTDITPLSETENKTAFANETISGTANEEIPSETTLSNDLKNTLSSISRLLSSVVTSVGKSISSNKAYFIIGFSTLIILIGITHLIKIILRRHRVVKKGKQKDVAVLKNVIGKGVYSENGDYIGKVKEVSLENYKIHGWIIKLEKMTSKKVGKNRIIIKPGRVKSIGKIMIIKNGVIKHLEAIARLSKSKKLKKNKSAHK